MRLKQPEEAVIEEKQQQASGGLKVDLLRKVFYRTVSTNIMVRARDDEFGKEVSTDIAYLDKQSLLDWLSKDQERTIKTVLVILGHDLNL